MMKHDHGRRLWAFLTRQRSSTAKVVVICDKNENRALSVACGIRDVIGKRNATVYCESMSEREEFSPPNDHIYYLVKRTRLSVI